MTAYRAPARRPYAAPEIAWHMTDAVEPEMLKMYMAGDRPTQVRAILLLAMARFGRTRRPWFERALALFGWGP